MYGLHTVRALLSRHAGRVASVTIASQHGDPRLAEMQALAAEAGTPRSRALAAEHGKMEDSGTWIRVHSEAWQRRDV